MPFEATVTRAVFKDAPSAKVAAERKTVRNIEMAITRLELETDRPFTKAIAQLKGDLKLAKAREVVATKAYDKLMAANG